MANKDNHRQKGGLPHSLVYNLGNNHTQSSKSFGYYGEKRLVNEQLILILVRNMQLGKTYRKRGNHLT